MAVTGSGSGQPQFISSTGNRSFSNAPLIENSDTNQIVVPDVSFGSHWISSLFRFLLFQFLVSIAMIKMMRRTLLYLATYV